jgi:hypothetical protein
MKDYYIYMMASKKNGTLYIGDTNMCQRSLQDVIPAKAGIIHEGGFLLTQE